MFVIVRVFANALPKGKLNSATVPARLKYFERNALFPLSYSLFPPSKISTKTAELSLQACTRNSTLQACTEI